MAYNDISKNFTYENGGTIDGDLALTTMAANTKIKNKSSGQLYVKRSGYTNVFDKTNTYANYLKADEFGINTSGSGNGVASITYSSSGRKITQNLTTFTTPSDLATANDNLKSQAVGSISVSGRTVTYKNVNGQTLGSFQTQDNNTTYSAGSGLSLSGTTFNLALTSSHIINALGYTPARPEISEIASQGVVGSQAWVRFKSGIQIVFGGVPVNTIISFPVAFSGVPMIEMTSPAFDGMVGVPGWTERSTTHIKGAEFDVVNHRWKDNGSFDFIAIGFW